MNCSSCGTPINPNERFCRNCGHEAVALDKTLVAPAPTILSPQANLTDQQRANPYAQTAQAWSPPETTPFVPAVPAKPRPSPYTKPLIIICALLAIAAGGVFAYYIWGGGESDDVASNVLPDHFGIFIQGDGALTELRRRDVTNALSARDEMTSEQLPQTGAQPSLILFAEPQDIPITDLKLVQLDSINTNGQVSCWNYQAAPVEGRANMKRIKVAGGLASGKYAFMLVNGYLNEGNHKFWPFQVGAGAPTPSDSPQVVSIPVKAGASPTPGAKPTATSTPKPTSQEKIAYCNLDKVFVRSTPVLDKSGSNVIWSINKGDKLRVLGTSTNYSTTYIPSQNKEVTDNWTQVELYDNPSVRGWVFSYFVSYR